MSLSAPTDFEEIDSPEFLKSLRADGVEGNTAFTALVKAANDRLFGFIRRQLSSREESLEVVQEVYLTLHKDLPGFAGKSRLTTWVFGQAHRKIMDRAADRKHARGETAGAGPGDGGQEGSAPPERLAPRNAVEALIGKAMESLPEQSLRIYHLRDVEGLSGEEAAEVMGIAPDEMRVQLHRARRHIVDWAREKMAAAGTKGKSGGEGGKA